jgi:hypothetical protein
LNLSRFWARLFVSTIFFWSATTTTSIQLPVISTGSAYTSRGKKDSLLCFSFGLSLFHPDLIQKSADRHERDGSKTIDCMMTSPETSSAALPESLPQAIDLSAGSPLRLSSPTIPLSQPGPTSIATSYLTSDRQKEDQMLAVLRNATPLDRMSFLPPCVPLVVETAEYLAAAALENWEMLCAEIECHRAVFKFCCTSRGAFDHTLFQSYCNRIRLIHNSLRCGMLVALRTQLDQLRIWLQISAVTINTGQSFLPDTNLYAEKFSQLTTILQELDRNSNAVRCPDAVSLGHDISLMREIFAQQDGKEAPLTTRGTVIENDTSPDAPITSTAIDHEHTAKPLSGDGSPSPTAQHLPRRRPKNSPMHDGTAPVEQKDTRYGSFPNPVKHLNTVDRYVNQRAEGDWTSMVDWEGFGDHGA